MTITIIQGQGTVLYTPLEQYGGSNTRTDARTDLYAFGAMLYHLLTNQPPAEARERFLKADSLITPRKINENVSPRTERAILWAMSLHPDDRPDSAEIFRQYLLGTKELPTRPHAIRSPSVSFFDSISEGPENTLFLISVVLFFLSLVTTFGR
jgi:serine/threonine-protein kinase